MFGQNASVAAQDPSYPVYVDSSVIMGMTGGYNASSKAFDGLEYMTCRPENDFFPDLSQVGTFLQRLPRNKLQNCWAILMVMAHTI